MAFITVENLGHTYSSGTPFEKKAICGINAEIKAGECISVLGHTGSGKSTFVQHLNALLQPSEGRVLLDGEDINRNKYTRRDVKHRVGLVFQYPEYQLFEETVFEDISFGPRNMKLGNLEIEERVWEAASFCGIGEGLMQRSPLELSGGQKRRIAIAGVIAMRPEVLILDEPTAGLDPAGSKQIMENIESYRKSSGATVMIVTHSMDDAARYSKRLMVFDHGRLCMDGSPEEVFSKEDALRSIGLDIPAAMELAAAIRERGIPLEGTIFTHEQLIGAIRRSRGGSMC